MSRSKNRLRLLDRAWGRELGPAQAPVSNAILQRAGKRIGSNHTASWSKHDGRIQFAAPTSGFACGLSVRPKPVELS